MRRGPGPARRAELRAGSAPRGDAAGAAQRRVGSDLPGAGDGRRAAPTSSSSSSSPAWRRPRLLAAGGRRERQEAGRPPAKAPPGQDRPGQRPEPRAPSAPRGRRARPAPPRGVIGSAPRQSGRARAAGSGGGAGAALRLRPGRACQAEGLQPPVPPASLSFVRPSVRPFVRRSAVTQAGECRNSEDWPRLAQRTALRQRESCQEGSAGSRLAAVMRRSKTVIDGTVQVVLNGRRQVASHMISYAPHAQERMKNHFTMIAKDCKVTHFRNVILIELEKTVLIQDHIISVMGPCESFLRVKRNICLLHLVDDEKKKHLLKWIYENK